MLLSWRDFAAESCGICELTEFVGFLIMRVTIAVTTVPESGNVLSLFPFISPYAGEK